MLINIESIVQTPSYNILKKKVATTFCIVGDDDDATSCFLSKNYDFKHKVIVYSSAVPVITRYLHR